MYLIARFPRSPGTVLHLSVRFPRPFRSLFRFFACLPHPPHAVLHSFALSPRSPRATLHSFDLFPRPPRALLRLFARLLLRSLRSRAHCAGLQLLARLTSPSLSFAHLSCLHFIALILASGHT